ncbi:hypothetical protein Bbelb_055630 [Branchiostoma belcheri]|nr:hypothetical protein Bbelb_055630 [Branchiostoma belcheri]
MDDLLPREFLPRREGFALLLSAAKTPSAANRPSRRHITRVAHKNNAHAQQDCEGGYKKAIFHHMFKQASKLTESRWDVGEPVCIRITCTISSSDVPLHHDATPRRVVWQ